MKLKLAIYRLIIIEPAAPVQLTISPIAAVAAGEEAAFVVSVATTPVVVPQVSYAYLPYASNYGYHALPTQYIQAAPAIQAAPIAQAVQVVQAAPSVQTSYASQPTAAIPAIYSETAHIFSQYIHRMMILIKYAAPVVSAAAAPVVVPQVSYAYLPYASNYGYHTVPPQHIQTNAVIQAASIAQDVQVSQTAPSIQT